MDILISHAFLAELHQQLSYDDRFFAFRHRARRRKLIARIQSLLDASSGHDAPTDLVEATRRFWEADTGVRVDDLALQYFDRDGIWISGWLRAQTGFSDYDRIDPARIEAAIASLPRLAGEVFTLHCRDDLDYAAIAARLGISVETVKAEIAAALRELDKTLSDNPSGSAG